MWIERPTMKRQPMMMKKPVHPGKLVEVNLEELGVGEQK